MRFWDSSAVVALVVPQEPSERVQTEYSLDRPERVSFVTLDARLAEAAEREGFDVVGERPE